MNGKAMPGMRGVFLQFIIHYLILLAVTSCIGGYVYSRSFDKEKRDVIESGIDRLEQSMALLDVRLNEVRSVSTQIALDAKLSRLIGSKLPYSGEDYYAMKEISERLATYKLSNRLIREVIVYLDEGTFISSVHTTASAEDFYGKVISIGGLSYDDWREQLLRDYQYAAYFPESGLVLGGREYRVVSYVQTVPIGALNTYKGAVLVLLDARELSALLAGAVDPGKGAVQVVAADGTVVTGFGQENLRSEPAALPASDRGYAERVEGGARLLDLHARSSANGWTYMATMPRSVISDQLAPVRNLYLSTMLVTLLVGLAIAILLSYRSSRPVHRIMRKLVAGFGEQATVPDRSVSAWRYLDGTIGDLLANREALRRDLDRQAEIARATFLERLLRGGFSKESEVETVRAHMGLDLAGEAFHVVAAEVRSFEPEQPLTADMIRQLELARVLLQEISESELPYSMGIYPLDERRTVLLIGLTTGQPATFRDRLEAAGAVISARLEEALGLELALGVGNACDRLIRIRNSFDEALEALEQAADGESIYYADLRQKRQDFYYPTDMEMRLIHLVKAGDAAEVQAILEELRQRNTDIVRVSRKMTTQLAYLLKGTGAKLRKSIEMDKETAARLECQLETLVEHRSAAALLDQGTALFLELTELARSRRSGQKDHWQEKIITLMAARYQEDDLSLTRVAEELGIKEKYVSQLFKEQLGESFTQHLERLRMDEARALLGDPEVPVQDISRLCGYATPNTFYKAFKRYYGVSPTVYRQQSTTGGSADQRQ
ncbi:AraC family transcriptional regulator [Paenibacillus sp. MY03]|uniref:AraC family transcriptional regulator n=1 Tax=Paenibacillus sp. MY03 TaxID=302980 RepID=UPI0015C58A25|nr:helix-turn-helix domain-containing protein [Paenibacillus sp. MY03]